MALASAWIFPLRCANGVQIVRLQIEFSGIALFNQTITRTFNFQFLLFFIQEVFDLCSVQCSWTWIRSELLIIMGLSSFLIFSTSFLRVLSFSLSQHFAHRLRNHLCSQCALFVLELLRINAVNEWKNCRTIHATCTFTANTQHPTSNISVMPITPTKDAFV